MCGGCGKPLSSTGPQDATELLHSGYGQSTTLPAVPSQSGHSGQDEPTVYSSQPPEPMIHPYQQSAPYAVAAPPPLSPYRRRRAWWRIPVVLLTVLAVLFLLAGSAWAAAIRPRLHTAVDSRLRTEMVNAATSIPAIPAQLGTLSFTVSEQELNAAIAARMPANAQVQDFSVHFAPGNEVIMSFRAMGQDNTISTRLSTRDGKIVSGDTQVLGPLGLVESGDEFQSVLQDTFAHITPQDHVETLSTDTGVLSLSIHG